MRSVPVQQPVELVEHADAAPGERGQRRAGHAHVRERPEPEDQARIEDEVDDVRHPQQPHGDRRVACAAKDRVVEKQHDDGAAAAQRNARVARAAGHNGRRSAHQPQQVRRKDPGRNAQRQRDQQAEHDRLHRRRWPRLPDPSRRCGAPPSPWSTAKRPGRWRTPAPASTRSGPRWPRHWRPAGPPRTHPPRQTATPAPSPAPWGWRAGGWSGSGCRWCSPGASRAGPRAPRTRIRAGARIGQGCSCSHSKISNDFLRVVRPKVMA